MPDPTASTYSTDLPPDGAARAKRRRDGVMWLVLLGAPTLWLAHLQLIYGLSYWAHQRHKTWPLHVGAVVSLLLCAAAVRLAWRTYRRAPSDATPRLEEVEEERVHFTMHMAFWASVLFLLGLLAQWLAVFMIDPRID
jgi:disulfide bond formation protein DsbB